jgi:protein gp37
MADGTHISWATATWNPITGCAVVSPGCVPCYAMTLAGTRLKHHPSRAGLTMQSKTGPVWNGRVRFNEAWLDQPLRWRKPRDIFVVAHGDLFFEQVPREWQDRVLDIVFRARQHHMLLLTKRPHVMAAYLATTAPMPHVWLGCSVEDQVRAEQRIEPMERLDAAGWNTWMSYEPALGPVDWQPWSFLRWLVAGGQSDMDGRSARAPEAGWFRAARDFAVPRAMPFHFKQWGAWAPHDRGEHATDQPMQRFGARLAGAMLDGREWRQMPWSTT